MKRKKTKLTREFWERDAENRRKLEELIAARQAKAERAAREGDRPA